MNHEPLGTYPPFFPLKQCPDIRGFDIRDIFQERIPRECRCLTVCMYWVVHLVEKKKKIFFDLPLLSVFKMVISVNTRAISMKLGW